MTYQIVVRAVMSVMNLCKVAPRRINVRFSSNEL